MNVLRGNNGPRYRHQSDDSAPYETISVDKLTPIIGAEIGGVDLSQPLGNHQMDEIHRALAENLVIFFRDQHLTPEQHLAFGRNFGELHIHPAAPHAPGHAGTDDHPCRQGQSRAPTAKAGTATFPATSEPPMGSILYIKTCPPKGGDTLFASMYAAYEALSDRMKAYLEGLTAIHDGEESYRGTYANYGVRRQANLSARGTSGGAHASGHRQEGALRQSRLHPPPRRRAARRERRRCCYYLYDHAENPLFQCRFRWQPNSVAFWDNRCVQHRAMWDYWPHTRSGFR